MRKAKLWGGSFLNYLFNDVITHIPFHFVRINFLRLFNRKIHPSVKILMHAKILNFWNVKIKERVVINQYCLLDCRRYGILIGSDSDIGPYTRVWTLGHDPDDDRHEVKGADVQIGAHVWIASGVTILPGVEIGDGAVVAAASVVTRSVKPLEIVGGNPAKLIRRRNNRLDYKLSFNPIFN